MQPTEPSLVDTLKASLAAVGVAVESDEDEPDASHAGSEAEAEDDAKAIEIGADQFNVAVHNGYLTIQSPVTGDHRTFKVSTVRGGDLAGKRVVALLIGPNREDSESWERFAFVGAQNGQPRVFTWKRYRGQDGQRSLYERFADLLERPGYWAGRGMKYLLSVRCRRCNRALTHPSSIMSGLGPFCEGRM